MLRCDVRRRNLTLRAEVLPAEQRTARIVQLVQRAFPERSVRGAAICSVWNLVWQ